MKKILVIDDEPDFLTLIKIRLEAVGYGVITASSGQEGLDKIKSEAPDVVFLDILMPEMDGLEVLKQIRQVNKTLPVFIITVFSDDTEFDQQRLKFAKDLGATGRIFKTKDLTEQLRNIVASLASQEEKLGDSH